MTDLRGLAGSFDLRDRDDAKALAALLEKIDLAKLLPVEHGSG